MTTANDAANTTAAPPAPQRGLADLYKPQSPGVDEMTEPDGSLRPHWRPLISMLDDLGREEVLYRGEQARRLIRENGITYNVYGDPQGPARPWSLDLLPLLITAAEWRSVGDALTQRTRLLNAILADIYGPETAVSRGLIPPELIYANPNFLRPCHGVQPPRGQWIHLCAADLARGADGQFRVLGDRAQAPSGAGYTLENRIVLSRVLPSIFTGCNVTRLAGFFISLRQTLAELAPSSRENPRVVVLTPGPYNETYFEHAYLARYLGYTLVQGNDLTVRDCRVYLKTLSGLQRVDVILRRVDDDFCDPLELYAQSYLGVPGLLQAVREGGVVVANAIGSGIVEAPALLPLLPNLCRHFLDEDLKISSIPTWWCGHADSCKYVLDNLSRLVIKPAWAGNGVKTIFGGELTRDELSELAARIRQTPTQFAGQENVSPYMAPVLADGTVQSRRFVVRAFLAATASGYTVMPGGLTRVTASPDSLVVSLQKGGGGSKDLWILADGPVSPVSLLTSPHAPLQLSRAGNDLPSRVADDVYWLGRYIQRAESVTRLARCIFNRLSDPNTLDSPLAAQILMRHVVGRAAPRADAEAPFALATAMFGTHDFSGLRSSTRHIHSLARVLRDRISSDAWPILQAINREITEFPDSIEGEDPTHPVLESLNRLVTWFLAFSGMASESMTRGQAWRFLDMGMRIERALAVTRLFQAAVVEPIKDEALILDAMLETTDSTLTYRRRYLTRFEAAAVADLLIADETNPRAVAFQARALEEHLGCLPRETVHPQRSQDHQLAIKLCAALRLEDLQAACQPTDGRRIRLGLLLDETTELLGQISERLAQTFFSHALTPSQLTQDQERPL
jgi:uncharacterized circularly permuted ATP-grasp superfamily protein/uncharacterized alpha-E superfamily protein